MPGLFSKRVNRATLLQLCLTDFSAVFSDSEFKPSDLVGLTMRKTAKGVDPSHEISQKYILPGLFDVVPRPGGDGDMKVIARDADGNTALHALFG